MQMENHDSEQDILLRVEGLKTYFFQRNAVLKAVDGVSFTIRKGRRWVWWGSRAAGRR